MQARTRARFTNTKSYAMYRMALALGRAINAHSATEKDRASRWAGAWGMLAGIFGKRIRLKHSDVLRQGYPTERRRWSR